MPLPNAAIKARAQLIVSHNFFANLLLTRETILDDPKVDTMAVDNRNRLYINTKWADARPVPELVYIFAHEMLHVILQHPHRMRHHQPQRANLAMDAIVNGILDESHVGTPPTYRFTYPHDPATETWEDIYERLPTQSDETDGTGEHDGPGGTWNGGDLLNNGLSPGEQATVDAQLLIDVAQAYQMAKSRGPLTGRLADIVSQLFASNVPWHERLRQYMLGVKPDETTWVRPNKRFFPHGYYLPSRDAVPALRHVVFQTDVSGSISLKELNHAAGHWAKVLEDCSPTLVHMLYVDSLVLQHTIHEPDNPPTIEHYSGGGTNMEVSFDYLTQQNITPDVHIIFTDGATPFTSSPPWPIVWLCSTNVVAPYGTTIPFTVET